VIQVRESFNCDKNSERVEDMAEIIERQAYKKLNLSADTKKEISVTPKVKDGKLLFDKNNKNHRYVVENNQ